MRRIKSSILPEVLFSAICLGCLILYMSPMLIFMSKTTAHDSFYIEYPIFHAFAESLLSGDLRLWDPFAHAGEPFYPSLIAVRFLDPIPVLTILFGQWITKDTVALFNWTRFLQSLFLLWGTYLVLRRFTTHQLIRLTLIPVLCFSSYFLCGYRQVGTLLLSMWLPLVMHFLLNIFFEKDYSVKNWMALSVCIGFNWQLYHFSSVWIFLLFFFIGMVFFHRELLKDCFHSHGFAKKAGLAALVVTLMMAPNLVLLNEGTNYVYPTRMSERNYDKGLPLGGSILYEGDPDQIVPPLTEISYSFVTWSGTFMNFWNFLQTISPQSNKNFFSSNNTWGAPSESLLYFGVSGWLLILIGMFFGKHPMKRLWLTLFIGFFFVVIGPSGWIHRILFYTYPPVRAMRHGSFFVQGVAFAALFFFVIGANRFIDSWRDLTFIRKWETRTTIGFLTATSVFTFLLIKLGLSYYEINPLWGICVFAFFVLSGSALDLKTRFSALFCAQILCTIYFGQETSKHFIWTLLLPLIYVAFLTLSKTRTSHAWLLPLVGLLFVDIAHNFSANIVLNDFPHHGKFLDISTTPQKLYLPATRKVSPQGVLGYFPQRIRGLSSLFRDTFVLTNLMDETHSSPSFEVALNSKRWVSLLLQRDYYDLIHSGISSEVLTSLFGVDQPLIQFKPYAITIPKNETLAFFKQKGGTAVNLLKDHVFIESETMTPSSSEPKITSDFSYEPLEFTPNSLKLQVKANQSGYLVWSDSYDKYWNVFIDEKPTALLRANHNFKAISLPTGEHLIRFTYLPFPFLISVFLFYGAVGIAMAVATVSSTQNNVVHAKNFEAIGWRPVGGSL